MYHTLFFKVTEIIEEGGDEGVMSMIIMIFFKEQSNRIGFLIPHRVSLEVWVRVMVVSI